MKHFAYIQIEFLKLAMNLFSEEHWWTGRRFRHPITKNLVQFHSLPIEEQQRLNEEYKRREKKKMMIFATGYTKKLMRKISSQYHVSPVKITFAPLEEAAMDMRENSNLVIDLREIYEPFTQPQTSVKSLAELPSKDESFLKYPRLTQFFLKKDKIPVQLWHEFAHHMMHQNSDIKTEIKNASNVRPVTMATQSVVQEQHRSPNVEAFADAFAFFKMNRLDMVDPTFDSAIRKTEAYRK
ncbi:MAG: hypothetical protein Q7R33_04990 [Nitrosarchaeum sp.]|nr:hypothetical protein [Nitrosarchaeum sp.]